MYEKRSVLKISCVKCAQPDFFSFGSPWKCVQYEIIHLCSLYALAHNLGCEKNKYVFRIDGIASTQCFVR